MDFSNNLVDLHGFNVHDCKFYYFNNNVEGEDEEHVIKEQWVVEMHLTNYMKKQVATWKFH
jgi:hypothetical protein